MRPPLTSECLKKPGCPDDMDLRECTKWPNNCPLAHIQGSDIILGSPQQKLFKDTQEDPE